MTTAAPLGATLSTWGLHTPTARRNATRPRHRRSAGDGREDDGDHQRQLGP